MRPTILSIAAAVLLGVTPLGCSSSDPASPGHDHPASPEAAAGDHSMHQHGNMPDHAGSDVSTAAYACPMHPEVTSDVAGKCPKCGMALVKK